MLSVSRLSCVGAVSVGWDTCVDGRKASGSDQRAAGARQKTSRQAEEDLRSVVEEDMRALRLKESDASNRDLWRTATKGDPSNLAVRG